MNYLFPDKRLGQLTELEVKLELLTRYIQAERYPLAQQTAREIVDEFDTPYNVSKQATWTPRGWESTPPEEK